MRKRAVVSVGLTTALLVLLTLFMLRTVQASPLPPRVPNLMAAPAVSAAVADGGVIGDHVWYDADGDSEQDAGEPGLAGIPVSLTKGPGVLLEITTDANGAYSFAGLALNRVYTVTLGAVAGYVPTTTTVRNVYLTASTPQVDSLDFGLRSELLEAVKLRPHGEICNQWNFWYYIFITNTAGITLTNLAVTDTLPYGIGAYSVQTGIGRPFTDIPGGTFDPVQMVVTWTLGSLGPGQTQAVWIKARTLSWAAGLYITNTAQVWVDGLEVPLPLMDVACVRQCDPTTPTLTPEPTATPPNPEPETVTIQKGTWGDSEDTYLYRYAPTVNYAVEPLLKVGYKKLFATILRFELSFIPASAAVQTATLEIYAAGWGNADITVDGYAITRTVAVSQATWNVAQAGNAWGTAGCENVGSDRRPTPEFTFTTAGPRRWHIVDITELVQAWVDGSMANNGLLLRSTSLGYSFLFASNEYSDLTQHPKLVVTYH